MKNRRPLSGMQGVRSRLSSCITSLALTALLCATIALLFPILRHPILLARLFVSPAPSAVRVPVMGMTRRQIRNSWGAPRSGGRLHKGVDIFAERGTPVLSATEGIVLRAGTNTLGGQVINVIGPGRQVHYYAHLDRYGAFKPGNVVYPGSILGYVGSTGNARGTPPHLHYGVYDPVRGAINPWPLLTPH